MYIVFDADTTMEVRRYKQFHHARNCCRVLNEAEKRRAALSPSLSMRAKYNRTFDVYHEDFYNQYIVYWEQVKNRMSGTLVWQKSNTALSCDVSSETYWSM